MPVSGDRETYVKGGGERCWSVSEGLLYLAPGECREGRGDDTVKVFEHWGQNSNMIRYNIGALSSEFFCGWGPRFRIAGM